MTLHIEEEARKCWCPHAVASHTDPRRGFHGTDDDKHGATFPCIASQCMAWRWVDAEADEKAGWTWRRGSKKWDEEGWYHPGDPSSNRVLLPRRGYCGIAGKPA